ncbi:MFS transporter [Vibrio comitans]|uniref:MFS transporter n=1 Tax=Vibrio comitans TaxID=413401 RepID=UPI001142A296|nr:MFS transporter [Vibrio comitans]
MSFQRKIVVSFTLILGLILFSLAGLFVLQHASLLNDLTKERIKTTLSIAAQPIESFADMGLPVSLVRNKEYLLQRAQTSDPNIQNLYLLNLTGIMVASATGDKFSISQKRVEQWLRSSEESWPIINTEDQGLVGRVILNGDDQRIAILLIQYDTSDMVLKQQTFKDNILAWACVTWLIGSLIGTILLGRTSKRIVKQLHSRNSVSEDISKNYKAAIDNYNNVGQSSPLPLCHKPASFSIKNLTETRVMGIDETGFTRKILKKMGLQVFSLVLLCALLLSLYGHREIQRFISPEINLRTQLITNEIAKEFEHAMYLNIPLATLVQDKSYFVHLISLFEEIEGLTIQTQQWSITVGRDLIHLNNSIEKTLQLSHQDQARLIFKTNSTQIDKQILSHSMDFLTLLIVVLLLGFELIALMLTVSITKPLKALAIIARKQAQFDFSLLYRGTSDHQQTKQLDQLNQQAVSLCQNVVRKIISTPQRLQEFGIKANRSLQFSFPRPKVLRLAHLSDIRFALFLISLADELPLSFFLIFSKELLPQVGAVNANLLLTLPLISYMIAGLVVAPFARPLSIKIGYRHLFLVSASLTILAKVAFFYSTNIPQLIFANAINGIGFVLALLACQDYALDQLPRQSRAIANSQLRATATAGVFTGTALGGVLAEYVGARVAFIVCAVFAVVAMVLIAQFVCKGRPKVSRSSSQGLSMKMLECLTHRRYLSLVIGYMLPLALIDHVFITYLLAMQLNEIQVSVVDISRAMLLYFLFYILGGSLLGKLPQRLQVTPSLLPISLLATSGALLLVSMNPSFIGMVWVCMLSGLCMGLCMGPLTDKVMRLAEGPLSYLGASNVLGLMRVIERGGAIIGLLVAGILSGYYSYAATLNALAWFSIGGVMLSLLLLIPERKLESPS